MEVEEDTEIVEFDEDGAEEDGEEVGEDEELAAGEEDETNEAEVKIEVDHILQGGTSSTPSVDSGEAITGDITCDEYVRSLAQKYSHLRNPYDGSPMITLWDG